jgi:hypothetical protein
MTGRSRILIATGLLLIAASSFLVGRRTEEKALAAKARLNSQPPTSRAAAIKLEPPSYHQLAAADILALPFPEFYEALRAAPAEAREKWAVELERMPPGPQRRSAVRGFYKLLVQFDPKTASTIVSEIKDKDLQDLAISSLRAAAPGFAMRDMAELILGLSMKDPDLSHYFEDVIAEWVPIDPAAVARFYDEHPDRCHLEDYQEVITNWAAIDPNAAREWMEKGPIEIEAVYGAFVSGWYLNDHTATVSYVLAHASEPVVSKGVPTFLRSIYLDSKDEAKKFIEGLPDERARHDAIYGAFEEMPRFSPDEETADAEGAPPAVAEWITQFPPDYWKGALRKTFEYWPEGPPEQVFAWIQGQAPEIRASLANEYTKLFNQSTTEAITAILQFADPNLRDQLITAMFRNTKQALDEDKESIAASSLSPEQKNRLLQIIAKVEAEKSSDQNAEKK